METKRKDYILDRISPFITSFKHDKVFSLQSYIRVSLVIIINIFVAISLSVTELLLHMPKIDKIKSNITRNGYCKYVFQSIEGNKNERI